MKEQFIFKLTPVSRTWLDDVTKDDMKPILQEHAENLKRLAGEGILVFDGHCLDGAFGVIVLLAEDDISARNIIDQDVFIQKGLMTYEMHPFVVTISKGLS